MQIKAAALVLLFGCASDETADKQTDLNTQAQGCSASTASQLFRNATQVDFDYAPLSSAAIAARSQLVVRGRATSVMAAGSEAAATTRLTVEITDVYKGDASTGKSFVVDVTRAEAVTSKEVSELEHALKLPFVTLFLQANGSGRADAPFVLTSPQGLIVAASCGAEQPLATELLFEGADSDSDVDKAVRSVTGT